MATERLNIVVNERGARVVQRNINDLGTASNTAAGAVDFLRSALLAIGTGGVVAVLGRLTNQFTQLQNRLRTVTTSTAELNVVSDELFAISQRTRSSFQSNAELFARLGQATRELGVSQQELLDFTESLNQAITISGASSIEAQAGIIQLSQGLASGALRGDELRSVLEQLPAVADVIAQSLGVTRGELRDLGTQGRITADIVLDAFVDAREELAERFNQTVLTLPQSFQVLENAAVRAFGELDAGLGITRGLAEAVVLLSGNLGILIDGLVVLGTVATSTGIAYGALNAAITATSFVQSTRSSLELARAVSAGTAVALGSAEAERQRAIAFSETERVQARATAATATQGFRAARADIRRAEAAVESTRSLRAALTTERELLVIARRQATTQTERIALFERLRQNVDRQNSALDTLRRQENNLTRARQAAFVASEARTEALRRVNAAQTANAAATAVAARNTSVLTQAINALTRAFAPLTAILLANPFVALTIGIGAAIGLLISFSDEIRVTSEGAATLADVFAVSGQFILRSLTQLGGFFGDFFQPLLTSAEAVFTTITILVGQEIRNLLDLFLLIQRTVLSVFDQIVGVAVGSVRSLQVIFSRIDVIIANPFQSAVALIVSSVNSLIDIFERAVNGIIRQANRIASSLTNLRIPQITIPDIQLPASFNDEVRFLANDVQDAFVSGLESQPVTNAIQGVGNVLSGTLDSILIAAEERAQARLRTDEQEQVDLARVEGEPARNVGQFREIVEALSEEAQLLQLNNRERQIQSELLQAIEQIESRGQTVNESERAALEILIRSNQALRERTEVLDQVNQRQQDLQTLLQATTSLVEEQAISQGQALQVIDDFTGGLLENTVEGNRALVESFRQTFEEIEQLRQADVISEQTAAQLRQRVVLEDLENRLANTRDFFSTLSTLSDSENRRLAAIGKAAAITQATIDGILAVQRALASAPPPVNFALAAAVGVAAAANVAEIAASRQLGGDLNPQQLSRVGEGTRPELFRSSVSGQQFMIPPERGRVEPLTPTTPVVANQDQTTQQTQVERDPVRITIVNNLSPQALENLINDPAGGRVVINFIGDNSGTINEQLGR